MRWDNLKMTTEEEERLPGYSDPAVIRHFDAPEAMGVKFYEVRAKSALNRVPEMSQVPFRWTINPYRGCTHACVFCLAGETLVLLANGRSVPLADIRPGDVVVGTEGDGDYRRYVHTQVEDHWQTVKPAYRVTLADGTELLASGDHRFLTRRGWEFVSGRTGPGGRPYLTTKSELCGMGSLAMRPEQTDSYRRGYLAGLIRGDGSSNRVPDGEPLVRARGFLRDEGVELRMDGSCQTRTNGATVLADIPVVEDLIEWPRQATDDWCKGFLAGIFDAVGSHSGGVVRIADTGGALTEATTAALRQLGLPHAVERTAPATFVRLRDGLRNASRFFHAVDPATTRKREVRSTRLESDADLRVVEIEPLGVEMPMYDITTGTGDFIANGVVSHNCFARPTHEYLDMNARDDFDRKIVVKVNLPEVLRRELNRPSWKGEHVALGTNTDPYQWVEKRYRLTRGVWEAMRDFRNPCSVLTKSPLLLRDLDLFQEIAAVTSFTANLSIPTIDEKVWRQTEPHTPNPRARIEAVAELTKAGIPCGVLVAPLMPGVNDDPAQVQEIVDACVEAGATHIGGICLHLRGPVKDIWFEWLEAYRPELLPRYEQMYARGAYAPKAERERITNLVRDARADSSAKAPPDYRIRPRGPAADRPRPATRPQAGRLVRGGLAQARSKLRDDELADDGAPIQGSLF